PSSRVDGQDVITMYNAVSEAVARARAGGGPSLIESISHRFREHNDPMTIEARKAYRSRPEVIEWERSQDPIELHKQKLLQAGVITEADYEAMDSAVMNEVDAAVEYSRQSPYAGPEELFSDIYADPIKIHPGVPSRMAL